MMIKITRAELNQFNDGIVSECTLNPDLIRHISECFAQLDLEQLGFDDD